MTHRTEKKNGERSAMTEYLEADVTVRLTRRELYWIREQNRRRLEAAMQGMNEPRSCPAKRSARWHEYCFHKDMRDHLYGVVNSRGEVEEEREEARVAVASELERRAEALHRMAQEFERGAEDESAAD